MYSQMWVEIRTESSLEEGNLNGVTAMLHYKLL